MQEEVYLVNVTKKTNQIQLPIGFGVLITSLKAHGIKVKLIDLLPVNEEEREEFLKKSLPESPTIFGFGIIAGNGHVTETDRFAKMIKSHNKDNIIVYGGPLPSAVPELILKNTCCDYVLTGESELSFPLLIKAIGQGNPKQEIAGLCYLEDRNAVINKNQRIKDLDEFSTPDYSLFDMKFYMDYLNETGQSFEIMASRGCRGNCSFCYKICGPGLSIRKVDNILDEISEIIDKYGIRRFYFVDENFFEIRRFFFEFIEKKKQRSLDFTFIVQSRIDTLDEEKCRIGAENGLICISTGIESASQETLDRINKRLTIEMIEKNIKIVRDNKIRISVNFIIGFPWETEKDFKKMIDFIKRNGLEKHSKLSYLTPLPATPLYDEAKEKGMIKDEWEYITSLGDLYWERMVNMTDLPDEMLDHYYKQISEIGQKEVSYPKSSTYLEQIKKIH